MDLFKVIMDVIHDLDDGDVRSLGPQLANVGKDIAENLASMIIPCKNVFSKEDQK